MKVLKSDNGGEYTFAEFKACLTSEGIGHQPSIPGRPDQNGVSKRTNRTFTERARSIRLQADMSERFLTEAMSHICYLVNSLPSTTVNLLIPEEI